MKIGSIAGSIKPDFGFWTSDSPTLASWSKVLVGAGVFANECPDYARVRTYMEQILVVRSAIGDKEGVAAALNNLATVVRMQGGGILPRDFRES